MTKLLIAVWTILLINIWVPNRVFGEISSAEIEEKTNPTVSAESLLTELDSAEVTVVTRGHVPHAIPDPILREEGIADTDEFSSGSLPSVDDEIGESENSTVNATLIDLANGTSNLTDSEENGSGESASGETLGTNIVSSVTEELSTEPSPELNTTIVVSQRVGEVSDDMNEEFDVTKIWCYSCNSVQDKGCDNQGDQFPRSEILKCDCSSDQCRPPGVLNDTAPVGCLKIEQEIPSHPEKSLRTRVIRKCAYSGEAQTGKKVLGQNGVKVWTYQCDNDDKCNSALSFGKPDRIGLKDFSVILLAVFHRLYN